MIRSLFSLVLLLAMSVAAVGAEAKADAAYGVIYAEERVVTLPQDEHKPYLTVFGNPNDRQFKAVKEWFNTHPTLTAIKDQTHFNVVSTNSVMFRDRYAGITPATPCIRLQAGEQIICEYAGKHIPMSADALAHAINSQAAVAECMLPWRNKVERHIDSDHSGGESDPDPQPLPPGPKPDTGVSEFWIGVLFWAVVLIGMGAGIAVEWNRERQSR